MPLQGQAVSGDKAVVKRCGDWTIVAVIDGLGHGEHAFHAADTAARTFESSDALDLPDHLRRCHDALQGTRGVAMSMAAVDARTRQIAWLGVGNVQGAVVRARPHDARPAREHLLQRAGVVGHVLPSLRLVTLPLDPGDAVVLATDGIRYDYANDDVLGAETAQRAADGLLERYRVNTDDALVMVLRYRQRKD